jgi:hypothetical protein
MVFHTQQLASNVGDSYIRFCSGTYRTARPSCRFKLTSFPIAPLLAKGPEQLLALPWFEDSYFVYALNLAPSVVALDSNDGCKTDVGGRSVVRVSAWRLQGIFLSAHRAPFGIAANVHFKSQRGSTASFPLHCTHLQCHLFATIMVLQGEQRCCDVLHCGPRLLRLRHPVRPVAQWSW